MTVLGFEERPTKGRYGRRYHDTKCADGFTCYGWRRITKGGYVTFASGKHYYEDFTANAGRWVYVILDDPFGINVHVFPGEPWIGTHIRPYNAAQWEEEYPGGWEKS